VACGVNNVGAMGRAKKRVDQRGAVLAEFVIALVPLLTIFFVFVQLSAISAARIRFKHAAVIGARCAAVYSNKNHTCPECEGDGEAEVTDALRAGLGSSARGYTDVNASVADGSSESDPYGLVTVTATAKFQCAVPLGRIICGSGSSVTFTERKSLPHQGAMYTP
jgi:Flp pilus assembly protein TadG